MYLVGVNFCNSIIIPATASPVVELIIDKTLSSEQLNSRWIKAVRLPVKLKHSPVVKWLVVRGSLITLKHVIHDKKTR